MSVTAGGALTCALSWSSLCTEENDGIISGRSRQRSLDVSEPEPFWCKTA